MGTVVVAPLAPQYGIICVLVDTRSHNMVDMPAVSVLIQVPPVFLIFAQISRARVEQPIAR